VPPVTANRLVAAVVVSPWKVICPAESRMVPAAVDQALADVHDRAGATLVADLLATGGQQVVEDRVVAQAQARLAHVDQVEVAELHVEAEHLDLGVLGLGLGGGTGDGDPAEQDDQQRERRAGEGDAPHGPPWATAWLAGWCSLAGRANGMQAGQVLKAGAQRTRALSVRAARDAHLTA
jgi:hypothetical protein